MINIEEFIMSLSYLFQAILEDTITTEDRLREWEDQDLA
jgi:hypothetical protein